MQFTVAILSILAASTALVPSLAVPVDIPILSEYDRLFKLCEAGGENTYVGVKYAGVTGYKTFDYNICYPYKIGDDIAQMAVFCKSVTCYNNPNLDCTGGAVPPVPVPVLAGLTLPNVANFVALLGQGATCHANSL